MSNKSLGVFASQEWQNYYLKLLEDNEIAFSYPKAMGLWRCTQRNIGNIHMETPTPPGAPHFGDVSATVQTNITIEVYSPVVELWENMPRVLYGQGLADSILGVNSESPYGDHAMATAQTRSIGRALKFALALDIHTSEEMSNAVEKPKQKQSKGLVSDESFKDPPNATSSKIKALASTLDNLKINAKAYLRDKLGNHELVLSRSDDKSLRIHGNIPREDIMGLLNELTVWQQKGGVPEEYLGN